jgi:NADP-dependent aldehyde dehydrogenase
MKVQLTGKQWIAGQWVSAGEDFLYAVNPATGETLAPPFAHATEAQVDAALQSAQCAFAVTRELSVERRVQLLETIAAQIMALGDELLQRAQAETGLPPARLVAERTRTCNQFALFAGVLREGSWSDAVIDTADPQRQPHSKPGIRRVGRPIGPVVVFGAGNFPFAYGACGGDTASALAAGNPVVVKAHERHPGVNELFAHAVLSALQQCGLPVEIFSLLQGPGTTVGQALVKHPATRAVGFTGSQRAGRILFDLAAARPVPIPVFAEMGSVNPVVILPGALAEHGEAIAAGLARSVADGAGQFCTKPGLVFLTGDAASEKFTAQLAARMGNVPATAMLAADMRQNFCTVTAAFQKIPGVRAVLAGAPSGFAAMSPRLFEVDSATWRAHGELHQEAFGPGAIVIRCRDLADLRETLPLVGGSLTGALHAGAADAESDVRELAQQLEQLAGRVIFNGFPTGVEVGHAMVHGGPYPATCAPATSSVGALALRRFIRPVCFQNVPDHLLPVELQNANPRGIWRTVNGRWTKDPVQA